MAQTMDKDEMSSAPVTLISAILYILSVFLLLSDFIHVIKVL